MRRWLELRFGAPREPAAAARWIVVDCETSGLDPRRDQLISLGAVGVRGRRIPARDCFSAVLRQAQPSARENILVHGIGERQQSGGEAPEAALAAFFAFAGDAPRVAYRAAFDQAVLARASGRRDRAPWLDLARLLPVLFPERGAPATSLDGWLAEFGIAHPARHDALGDAYATAQLFQVALAESGCQGFRSVGAVLRAAGAGRWTGNSPGSIESAE